MVFSLIPEKAQAPIAIPGDPCQAIREILYVRK